MILPDDVLSLIRAFSKPCFKYFKEYRNVLKRLGRHSWSKLKSALLTNPDTMLTLIYSFETIQDDYLNYWKEHNLWYQTFLDNHCVEEEGRKERQLILLKKGFDLRKAIEDLYQ
jgi:hypothetical protein